MDFFRPTHPLNLENSRIFFFLFLTPSLNEIFLGMEGEEIQRRERTEVVIFLFGAEPNLYNSPRQNIKKSHATGKSFCFMKNRVG